MVFLPVLAHTDQMAISEIGVLIFISSISMVIFQQLSGKYADTLNRYLLLAIGAGTMTISLLLFTMRGDFISFFIFSGLLGAGLGISLTTVSALAVIEGRKHGQGSVEGIINTVQGIGIIICPLILGLVMDTAGISMVFLIAAGVSGVMAVVMMRYAYQGLHIQPS